MATNYDEYLDKLAKKTAKLKAKNPEKHKKAARDASAKHKKELTYYCQLCKVSFGKKSSLTLHRTTPSHLRKAEDLANKPHQCNVCNVAFELVGNLNKHLKTPRHLQKLAALSSSKLD
jgi:CRISPR/Cas system-associated protein Cas10 (large subunit of type III CRISPR-Cas system)